MIGNLCCVWCLGLHYDKRSAVCHTRCVYLEIGLREGSGRMCLASWSGGRGERGIDLAAN